MCAESVQCECSVYSVGEVQMILLRVCMLFVSSVCRVCTLYGVCSLCDVCYRKLKCNSEVLFRESELSE